MNLPLPDAAQVFGLSPHSQSGCKTLYAPSEPFTLDKLGTTQLEGCGSAVWSLLTDPLDLFLH